MPTPVGHLLSAGLVLAAAKTRLTWQLVAGVCFFAIFPDLDFVFGFLTGDPNRFHHHFTHSFFFTACAGIAAAALVAKNNYTHFKTCAVLFVMTAHLHLVTDLLALDTSAPYGAPVLWPFSQSYYISPVVVFSDVHRSSESHSFIPSLFSMHNLMTVIREVVILMPPLIILVWWRRKKGQENA